MTSPAIAAPTARGACPRLLMLSNVVLALSCGRAARPTQGDHIIFSVDAGRTWTNDTEIFAGLSSGCTQMVETEPGKILHVFDSVAADRRRHAPPSHPGARGAVIPLLVH